jgi:hypothetical protein
MAAQPRAHTFDDPSIPHPARRYNYLLGGRENYRVDRASAAAISAAMPSLRVAIEENRAFLRRAVRFMVGAGIRQFIDIGPGIPAPDCTHEVAQAIAPETRVVYVDNDPIVIAYSRALLRNNAIPEGAFDDGSIVDVHLPPLNGEGSPDPVEDEDDDKADRVRRGLIGHVLADVCESERILTNPETRTVIDFSRPVGLLLVAVTHFCTDDEALFPAVAELIGALPPDSMVAFSQAAPDYVDPRVVTRISEAHASHNSAFRWRYAFDCARFAEDLEFVDPGIVPLETWHAEQEPRPRPSSADVAMCAWVARKP